MEELTSWGEYITLFAGLFAMINLPKNVPIFVNLTSDHTPREQNRAAIAATLTALVVLESFVLFGDNILLLFRITINHIEIAGGVILLVYALAMVGVIATPESGDDRATGSPIAVGMTPSAYR
ncbi:MAG: hypothetical protein GY788_18510 [bacterium]|nr:hypothetical protein [bacterium]